MKSFFTFSSLIILGNLAFASTNGRSSFEPCARRATHAVWTLDIEKKYDRGGIKTYNCEMTENSAAVICEVFATKGNDTALDTYSVILNKRCTKVFRVELTGEE